MRRPRRGRESQDVLLPPASTTQFVSAVFCPRCRKGPDSIEPILALLRTSRSLQTGGCRKAHARTTPSRSTMSTFGEHFRVTTCVP